MLCVAREPSRDVSLFGNRYAINPMQHSINTPDSAKPTHSEYITTTHQLLSEPRTVMATLKTKHLPHPAQQKSTLYICTIK